MREFIKTTPAVIADAAIKTYARAFEKRKLVMGHTQSWAKLHKLTPISGPTVHRRLCRQMVHNRISMAEVYGANKRRFVMGVRQPSQFSQTWRRQAGPIPSISAACVRERKRQAEKKKNRILAKWGHLMRTGRLK
jgi:hypothetical protein